MADGGSTGGTAPTDELRVFDVNNLFMLARSGRFAAFGQIDAVRVLGNRLFTVGSQFGIIDLSFPAMVPVLTSQLKSRTHRTGEAITFEAAATGAELFAYQWYRSGHEVKGAKGPTLNLPAEATGNGGDYTVEVSNTFGRVLSASARLTVIEPPVLAQLLISRTLFAGEVKNLPAGVSGLDSATNGARTAPCWSARPVQVCQLAPRPQPKPVFILWWLLISREQ